ncbi:MlaD family protein [Amycolatopsis thermophila]|uniref:Phospholipid/cholesterol/gamma-HCH transport system substrate-binding protein n=1 Tax=Amycolatopsis thermophila TaxID=206084 RepID=A0ABU0EQI9_9PSEU|nr:MlaD family protein [Amycolatopsis thermophila]MDQ0377569.1 phospholipid/cholesterol/gamma-HCH transport system substrate-binding protein [Amycolatopsis thermophila]
MLVRKTRIQLVAFLVISVVAIVYALIRFAGLGQVFGQTGYTVKLDLNSSGGIFTGAEVTYRGFNIGKVGQLRLTADGLQADLEISPDTPQVPANLQAVIANRSAVGEQFVDLRPVADGGPYLQGGSVIPAAKTEVPIGTDQIITDLDSLASSVPKDALRTVVDESYNAFNGTGRDLQELLDTARDFTGTAQQYLPQTVQLLDSGEKVLATQNAQAGNLAEFSRNLNELSATLKGSDADIRRLIEVAPGAAQTLNQFVADLGPGLGELTANLLTTSNLLLTRQDGIQQVLVSYPVLAVGARSVAPGDGTAHLGLALNLFDPPVCTKGYMNPENYRTGAETTPRDPNLGSYCAEPAGSPIDVRGAQNAPYNGVPVAPTPEQVQQNSDRDEQQLAYMRGTPGVVGSPGVSINSLSALLGLP